MEKKVRQRTKVKQAKIKNLFAFNLDGEFVCFGQGNGLS